MGGRRGVGVGGRTETGAGGGEKQEEQQEEQQKQPEHPRHLYGHNTPAFDYSCNSKVAFLSICSFMATKVEGQSKTSRALI